MLKGPQTIRLTNREVVRWTKITGFEPVGVRTEQDLERYVARCRKHFWGTSADTRFLHHLMDEELACNLSGLLPDQWRSNDASHDDRVATYSSGD